jgi:hypothetical protein
MYQHENLLKSISVNNFNDLTLIEIKGQPVKHNNVANSQVLFWEPICLFMGLLILCSLVPKIGGKFQNGFRKNIKSQQKSPCTKCEFFSNNPHLKCAAQPSLVLTEQARDCPDYRLDE